MQKIYKSKKQREELMKNSYKGIFDLIWKNLDSYLKDCEPDIDDEPQFGILTKEIFTRLNSYLSLPNEFGITSESIGFYIYSNIEYSELELWAEDKKKEPWDMDRRFGILLTEENAHKDLKENLDNNNDLHNFPFEEHLRSIRAIEMLKYLNNTRKEK